MVETAQNEDDKEKYREEARAAEDEIRWIQQ